MRIPAALEWRRSTRDGREWLAALPRIAGECADEWSLRLGDPFPGSNMALVVPAELADGRRAVLKISGPNGRGAQEASALACWNGDGAVLLMAHDRERGALLLEACEPGTPLARGVDASDALGIATALLRRLWRPPPAGHCFVSVEDDVHGWSTDLPSQWESVGRRFERALVDEAMEAVVDLAPTQNEQVLLHGDFHARNVLRAQRAPWLAIDPYPLVGERAVDAASLLRDGRAPTDARDVARRLDALADALALDRERLRRWGIVNALQWGVSWAKAEDEMVRWARLLVRAARRA